MSWRKWQKIFWLKPILVLLSWIYLLGYYLRKLAYRIKIKRGKELNAQVISVGNLTLGGTGKTPVVLYLTQKLREQGKKVAILARGFKRKNKNFVWITGEEMEKRNWEDFGDEPFLLAQNLRDVPILVQKNRFGSGLFAKENFGSEVLLLDDGFQHWQLQRDWEIVVIDCSSDLSKEKIFPLGNLREPIKSLKRADLIILNHYNKVESVNSEKLIKSMKPDVPIVKTVYKVDKVIGWQAGQEINWESLREKKGISFCGIGNPNSFISTLSELGLTIVDSVEFKDHHIYNEKDLLKLEDKARHNNAKFLITTEKDRIRLPKIKIELPVYILKIKLKIVENKEGLEKVLL